jgi:hypothetical protein
MAAHYDLNITQGNSFNVRLVAVDLNGTAYDLTNWSLRGHAKVGYSESAVLIDLQPTKVSPYNQGFIDISLPSTFTKTLPITEGVFDIEMYDSSGFVDKLIKGYVRIYPEVTN